MPNELETSVEEQASIDWMVLQSALLVPVPWQAALRKVVTRL